MPAQERPRSYSSDLSISPPNFFWAPVVDFGAFTPTEQLSSLESDDHYAPVSIPIIPYEPIPIPREPTLEELLREASGDTEWLEVEHLKLTVIAEDMSLQRVATYCPLLTSLNLEGSALSSLRDLGCMMTALRYLNVSRCGLRSLDGTSGLGSVTHLVANNNQIQYLDPCNFLDNLQELSVEGNNIQSTYNLLCLALCPSIRTINIIGNPIEEEVLNLKEEAMRIIPQLIIFNGERVREDPVVGCTGDSIGSSYQDSTSTSGGFSSREKSLDSINSKIDSIGSVASKAPSSPNMQDRPRTSDDALLLRAAYSSLFAKEFPSHLPQTPVKLEMGVIGTILKSSSAKGGSEPNHTSELLLLARKWREFRASNKSPQGRSKSAKGCFAMGK